MRQLIIVILFVIYMYFVFSSFSGTTHILGVDEKDCLSMFANSSFDFSNVSDSFTCIFATVFIKTSLFWLLDLFFCLLCSNSSIKFTSSKTLRKSFVVFDSLLDNPKTNKLK